MKQKCIYILLILLAGILPYTSQARSLEIAREKYRVLYIQSSDNQYLIKERKALLEKAFREADIPVDLYYLSLRTHDVEASYSLKMLRDNLDTYNENLPDIILTVNDDALNFVMASEHSIVLKTPIVFSNVIIPLPIIKDFTRITGQLETIDYRQAYELGKRLFGEVDELQVVYGFQREDFHLKDTADSQLKDIPEFTFLRELSDKGPEDTPIDTVRDPRTVRHALTISNDLPTVWPRDQLTSYYKKVNPVRRFGIKACGEYLFPGFMSYQFQPFIGVTNAYFFDEGFQEAMPHGVIGGYFNTVGRQVDKAVDNCLRILKGEPAESIPIDTGLRIPIFDWKLMQYWGISKDLLPEGSVIVNEPFVVKYKKTLIIGGMAGILLIILFMSYLIRFSREIRSNRNSSVKKLHEEQERIRTTINAVSDCIVSLDCKETIVSINPAAQKLLELDEQSMLLKNRHISSFVKLSPRYKRDPFWFHKLVARSAETHEEQSLPEGSLLELRSGRSLQISGICRSLFMNGIRVGTLFAFRDCTDKLRQEQFLEFSMAAGDVYTWQINIEKKEITFHESFFATNGIDREVPTLGKDEFISLLHPDDRELWIHELDEVIGNTKVDKCKLQVRLKLPVGYVWFEFRLSSIPVVTDDRKNIRLFGICLSIQKLKETESVMQKVLEEAKESDRIKSEFLANMSHEIRTPLNVIVGFSTIINEVEDEEKAQFFELITKNCDTLLRTINDILDISRVESGFPFQFKVCYLKKFLSEVWSDEQSLFEDTDVEFFLEVPDDECLVETDVFRLRQMLEQLIRNARNFTIEGSVTLGYRYRTDDKYVIIYVRDTGLGIAPEDRQIVFERFYKLDKFTSGGGLGLSLCKEIVQRFNGSIQVTDGLHGKGTCVIVNLPVHQVQ
ncbi:ATP-binding protein [Parabacteroides segnis]|uniref:sensor histidine kinase n=1 Tax=Parabacteroides segnis TaxID=2763058 RepID=UPI00351761B6